MAPLCMILTSTCMHHDCLPWPTAVMEVYLDGRVLLA